MRGRGNWRESKTLTTMQATIIGLALMVAEMKEQAVVVVEMIELTMMVLLPEGGECENNFLADGIYGYLRNIVFINVSRMH